MGIQKYVKIIPVCLCQQTLSRWQVPWSSAGPKQRRVQDSELFHRTAPHCNAAPHYTSLQNTAPHYTTPQKFKFHNFHQNGCTIVRTQGNFCLEHMLFCFNFFLVLPLWCKNMEVKWLLFGLIEVNKLKISKIQLILGSKGVKRQHCIIKMNFIHVYYD